MRRHSVVIARGDLAAQIGFERIAELDWESMCLCDAATGSATQLLGSFVRDGVPSRRDRTDAAMAAPAECVCLTRG